MADPKQQKADTQKSEAAPEPAKVVREAVRETDTSSDDQQFSVERLVNESSAFLGHPSHVVAGALHGVNRKNLTVEEAKAAVDAWLEAPVKES